MLSGPLGPDGVRTAAGDPLRLWEGHVVEGTPVAVEHAALRWLAAAELFDVPWIEADVPLVEAVAGRLRGRADQSTHSGGTP